MELSDEDVGLTPNQAAKPRELTDEQVGIIPEMTDAEVGVSPAPLRPARLAPGGPQTTQADIGTYDAVTRKAVRSYYGNDFEESNNRIADLNVRIRQLEDQLSQTLSSQYSMAPGGRQVRNPMVSEDAVLKRTDSIQRELAASRDMLDQERRENLRLSGIMRETEGATDAYNNFAQAMQSNEGTTMDRIRRVTGSVFMSGDGFASNLGNTLSIGSQALAESAYPMAEMMALSSIPGIGRIVMSAAGGADAAQAEKSKMINEWLLSNGVDIYDPYARQAFFDQNQEELRRINASATNVASSAGTGAAVGMYLGSFLEGKGGLTKPFYRGIGATAAGKAGIKALGGIAKNVAKEAGQEFAQESLEAYTQEVFKTNTLSQDIANIYGQGLIGSLAGGVAGGGMSIPGSVGRGVNSLFDPSVRLTPTQMQIADAIWEAQQQAASGQAAPQPAQAQAAPQPTPQPAPQPAAQPQPAAPAAQPQPAQEGLDPAAVSVAGEVPMPTRRQAPPVENNAGDVGAEDVPAPQQVPQPGQQAQQPANAFPNKTDEQLVEQLQAAQKVLAHVEKGMIDEKNPTQTNVLMGHANRMRAMIRDINAELARRKQAAQAPATAPAKPELRKPISVGQEDWDGMSDDTKRLVISELEEKQRAAAEESKAEAARRADESKKNHVNQPRKRLSYAYEARLKDRIERINKAKTEEEVFEILKEEYADKESTTASSKEATDAADRVVKPWREEQQRQEEQQQPLPESTLERQLEHAIEQRDLLASTGPEPGSTREEQVKRLNKQIEKLRKKVEAQKPKKPEQSDEDVGVSGEQETGAQSKPGESIDNYKKRIADLKKARDAEFKKYKAEKNKKEKSRLSKSVNDIDSQIRELESSIDEMEDKAARLNKPEDDKNVVTEDPYGREIDDPVANERKRIAVEYALEHFDEFGFDEKLGRRHYTDSMEEEVDDPGRYHQAVEQENKAGLRIGDIVIVDGKKAIVLSVQRDIDGMSDHTVLLEPGNWTPPNEIKKTGKNIFDGDTGQLKAKGIAKMKERLAKLVSKGRGNSADAEMLRDIIAKREGREVEEHEKSTLPSAYYNQFFRMPNREYGFETEGILSRNSELLGDDNSPGIISRLEDAKSKEEALAALKDLREFIESASEYLADLYEKEKESEESIKKIINDIGYIGTLIFAYGSGYAYATSGDILESTDDDGSRGSKFDFEYSKASPFAKSVKKSKSGKYNESDHSVEIIPGYATEDGMTVFNPPYMDHGSINTLVAPISIRIIEAKIDISKIESGIKENSGKKRKTRDVVRLIESLNNDLSEKKEALARLEKLSLVSEAIENFDEAGEEPNPEEDPADVAERERMFAEDDAARPETTDEEREVDSIRIEINDLKKKISVQKEVAQEADEQQAMADDSPASIRKAARENKKLEKLQAELRKLEAAFAAVKKPDKEAKPVVEQQKPASNEPEKAAEKVTDELERLVEVGDAKNAKQVFERVLATVQSLLPDAIKRAGFENVEFVPTGKLSGNVLVDGKSIGVINGGFFQPNQELEKRFVGMDMNGFAVMTPAQRKRAVERSVAEHLAKTSKGYNKYVVRIPGDGTFKIDANPVSMRELVQNIRREGPSIWKNIAGYKAEATAAKPTPVGKLEPTMNGGQIEKKFGGNIFRAYMYYALNKGKIVDELRRELAKLGIIGSGIKNSYIIMNVYEVNGKTMIAIGTSGEGESRTATLVDPDTMEKIEVPFDDLMSIRDGSKQGKYKLVRSGLSRDEFFEFSSENDLELEAEDAPKSQIEKVKNAINKKKAELKNIKSFIDEFNAREFILHAKDWLSAGTAKSQESLPEKPTPAQEAEFARKAAELDRRREARRRAQETNENPITRRRGPEQVMQRLVNELRRGGTMSVAQVNTCIRLIEALIDNGYLDNLAVSPSESVNYDAATKGEYDAVNQIVRLFVMNIADDGTGKDVGENFIHEVAHHLERMLPESDIRALRQDLTRARAAWLKNKKGLRELLGDGNWLQKSWTERELDAHVDKMIADGKMTEADRAPFWEMLRGVMKRSQTSRKYSMAATKEAYKLMNTSEWFAVNVGRIATERDQARPNAQGEIAIWSRLRNLMSRFYGAVQQFLGRENAERIWNNFQEGRYEAEFQRYNMAAGDDGRAASMQEDPENMPIPGGQREKFLKSKEGQEPVVKPIRFVTDIGHNEDDPENNYLWAIDATGNFMMISVKHLMDAMSDMEMEPEDGLVTHTDWSNLIDKDVLPGNSDGRKHTLLRGSAHGRAEVGDVIRMSIVGHGDKDSEHEYTRETVKDDIGRELRTWAKSQDVKAKTRNIKGYDFTGLHPWSPNPEIFNKEEEAGFTRDNEPNHDNAELAKRGFLTKIAGSKADILEGMTVEVKKKSSRGYDYGNKVYELQIKDANGQPIAWIDYRVRPNGETAFVNSSNVTQSMRKKGYGTVLYAEMGERLRRQGVTYFDGVVKDKLGRPISIRENVFGKDNTNVHGWTDGDLGPQTDVETEIDPNRPLSSREEAGFTRDNEPNHGDAELASRGFITKFAYEMRNSLNGTTITDEMTGTRNIDEDRPQEERRLSFTYGKIDYIISKQDDGEEIAFVEETNVDDGMRNKDYSTMMYAELGERLRRRGVSQLDGKVIDQLQRPIKARERAYGSGSTEVVSIDRFSEKTTGGDPEIHRWVTSQIDPNRPLSAEEKAGFERDVEVAKELIAASKRVGGGTFEKFMKAMDDWARSVLKPGKLNTIGPALLAAMVWQSARNISRGMNNFAAWSKSMIRNFGPNIKGSLPAIWRGAKNISKNFKKFPPYRYLMGVSSRVWDNVERNPQSPTLRRMAGLIMVRTGPDSEAAPDDIPTRIKRSGKQFTNLYSALMERFALEFSQMDEAQRRKWDEEFFAHVTNGTVPSDKKMADAVSDYRDLMAALLAYQQSAGVPVMGIGPNYMPRAYSMDAVEADPDGFIAAASEAYKLRNERLRDAAERALAAAMVTKAKDLKQEDIDAGRKIKTDAEYKAIADKWEQRQQEKINEEFDKTDDDFKKMAEQWMHNILYGKITDMTLGQMPLSDAKTDSIEHRIFNSIEADVLYRFLIKDVESLTVRYIRNAVTRAETARVFGADGKGFTTMMNQLLKEGVPVETIQEMQSLFNAGVGLGLSHLSPGAAKLFDWLNVVIAASYLGMSFMYNMILEPSSFGIRTNLLTAAKGFALTWYNLARELLTLTPAQRQLMEAKYGKHINFAKRFNEALGEDLGLLENELERHYSDRHWDYSETDRGSKLARRISQSIYRANLMAASEKAKVEASITVARLSIRSNARFMLGEHPLQKLFGDIGIQATATQSTKSLFNELGIPESEHQDFAEFVMSLDGKDDPTLMAMIMDKKEPMAAYYRQAISRMSLGLSVKASPATRIADADSLFGKFVMQLQNYTYAFYAHNIEYIYRATKAAILSKNLEAIDRVRYMAPLVGGIAAMIAAFGQQEIKHAIDPSEGTRRRQAETPIEKGLDAATLAGAFPPPLQILAKFGFQEKIPGGPMADIPFQITKKTFRAATKRTDAAQRAAVEQAIEVGVKPTVIGATALAHPALGAVINLAAQREEFTNTLADLLTGPDKNKK